MGHPRDGHGCGGLAVRHRQPRLKRSVGIRRRSNTEATLSPPCPTAVRWIGVDAVCLDAARADEFSDSSGPIDGSGEEDESVTGRSWNRGATRAQGDSGKSWGLRTVVNASRGDG
eukprot:666878-Pleurochrysis_carterae.AAC.1